MGDFNSDGKTDVVATDWDPSAAASVLLGNGNGTFKARQSFATGTTPRSVAVGDVNGDGITDLVTADHGSNTSAFCSATATVPFRLSRTSAQQPGLSQLLWATSTATG